jgi:MoaA/NifB/PqqE/SkfB family radical SAM enzyme
LVFKSPQWETVLSKKDRTITAERWMEIWDGIYERYGSAHVHCSGGEPFNYPRFIDIVAHLTRKHTMECDTNLSFDPAAFIGRVKPGTFRFSPSFHPEFAVQDPYIQKCRQLREAGYDLEGVNYVCWPPHLKGIPELKRALEGVGVVLTLMPFRGSFQGKDYPDAYTLEERRFINAHSGNPVLSEDYGGWYKGANQGGENQTRRAALCRAGEMYAKIHPDGTALRCCLIDDRGRMGSLIDGTFQLYEGPRNCEFSVCSCWKCMIVGEEGRWLRHWKGVVKKSATPVSAKGV